MKITKRQQAILDLIALWMKEHGRPPAVREIGSACGIKSPNGVQGHLKALETKGLISREGAVSRGIRVVGFCPCCGTAGTPADGAAKTGGKWTWVEDQESVQTMVYTDPSAGLPADRHLTQVEPEISAFVPQVQDTCTNPRFSELLQKANVRIASVK